MDVELPYNAVPGLNPLTSPTGEIFRYVVESDRHDLRELTDLHKWVIIPRLKQVTGVADVSNYGGITTQYQIEIDPHKLEQYGISLADVVEKVEKNNVNAGGSMISHGDLSYVIRGIGLVKGLEDLGNIVVKTENGVPVYLSDIGRLKYGNLERKGVLGFTDDTRDYQDGVEGIVQMVARTDSFASAARSARSGRRTERRYIARRGFDPSVHGPHRPGQYDAAYRVAYAVRRNAAGRAGVDPVPG